MSAPSIASQKDVSCQPNVAIAKEARHYVDHRPPYPESMWNLWTSYHDGPLQTVHDIGSGSGNGADGLLMHVKTPMKHVVLTEPREINIQDCRARFRDRFPGTEFTYRICGGEDPWETPAGLGAVDFVMACESLHWTIIEPTLQNVAKSLRKGGTFAAVVYGPFPGIANNQKANEAFKEFIGEHAAHLLKQDWLNENWKRAARQMFHGMDCVPLRDDVWQDVKRIEINCRDGWYARDYEPIKGTADSVTHLGPFEKISVDDNADWQISASTEWLRESLNSMRFGFTEKSWESSKWLEMEQSVGNMPLELQWQVQMILARKKN
ncbi:yhr209w-like protein [Colletotrichum truncatum]|uniref:Yhr209w-like protein n=1 Tax=Colletotrichum truncatum TaxID=5467 RepID=A0ACC3YLF4_COLTU|nr:yhr209w-like protein [Colletotrichum truncatum]KAF6780995.1 yhr209w-like protein [Colletotrichum truncatum]